MFRVLDCRAPCTVFLDKTVYPHSTSLHESYGSKLLLLKNHSLKFCGGGQGQGGVDSG